MITKKLLFILIGIFLISLVSAADGCCFDTSTGICQAGKAESSCVYPGEFHTSPTCSITLCDSGCCVIGTNALYTTRLECDLESRRNGLSISQTWLGVRDEASCSKKYCKRSMYYWK